MYLIRSPTGADSENGNLKNNRQKGVVRMAEIERNIKRKGRERGGGGGQPGEGEGGLYVFETRERICVTTCSTVISVMCFLISAYSSSGHDIEKVYLCLSDRQSKSPGGWTGFAAETYASYSYNQPKKDKKTPSRRVG